MSNAGTIPVLHTGTLLRRIRLKSLAVSLSVLLFGTVFMVSAEIIFYTDQALFESLYPGLTTEDYSNTNVPPNSMETAQGPFNSFTNNNCFSEGAIVEGISIDNFLGHDNVVLTPPYMGVTSVSVGPNEFDDNTEYTFTVPVNAFGIEIVMPMGDGGVSIKVYGEYGYLRSSYTNVTPAGVFWGVFCDDEDITMIEFIEPTTHMGELFTNVQFGSFSALDNTTWGAIKSSF